MTCPTCGGNHVGTCPGVRRTCGECGTPFIAGGATGWHNHSLCSARCCAIRRAKLARPSDEEDDEGLRYGD